MAGIATSAAGLAALATGLYLGHRAGAIGTEVTEACRVACDWEALRDKEAAGRRDATIGRVLDGVGAAAIVGGAVAYYLGTRHVIVTRPVGRGAVVSWRLPW